MKKLSKSQQKIYDFLKEKAQYGIPPSVREICAATGLRSTSTVHAHLKTLEEEGYITRQAGMNRSIHIEGCDETAQVPIVGRVTAGMPILAVEEVQGYVPYSGRAGKGKELFALHVQGYSMKNAGILDGDYVIAEKVSTADDGDIVVALIEDEATVKRLYREKDCIRLQPENEDFEPIYSRDVMVLGRVIAVIRYY
ncbi:MAG: transcriptional repressor LexA [Acutalibacteraceae bacterium]|nr:transcriptional repressor LexA [Bacillota bacterium]